CIITRFFSFQHPNKSRPAMRMKWWKIYANFQFIEPKDFSMHPATNIRRFAVDNCHQLVFFHTSVSIGMEMSLIQNKSRFSPNKASSIIIADTKTLPNLFNQPFIVIPPRQSITIAILQMIQQFFFVVPNEIREIIRIYQTEINQSPSNIFLHCQQIITNTELTHHLFVMDAIV